MLTARRPRLDVRDDLFAFLTPMHRDTQIGLAMAIVLIGFAAALCFPRNGLEERAAMSLPNAAALDAAIDQLPVKVYTEHSSTNGAPASPPSNTSSSPVPPVVAPGDHRPSTETSRSTGPAPASSPGEVPPPVATPEPVALDPVTAANLPPTAPATRAASGPEAEPVQYHVVKPGDTLSGLAQQYLGSVARYPDLFEANRDILQSPDALRLNMRLRIPAPPPARQFVQHPTAESLPSR